MGTPSAGRRPVRRAIVVGEPVTPPVEPVPMLVNLDGVVHAWVPSLDQLRPLPDLGKGPSCAPDAIAAGGRVVLFERATRIEDASTPYDHRRRSTGVWRLNLSSGAMERAGYDPVQRPNCYVGFAGSPDAERVAIVQEHGITPPTRDARPEDARATVWLAGFDGSPPCELTTWVGETFADADDVAVQWSFDGTWIAVAVSCWQGSQTGYTNAVVLFDANSGREVRRLQGLTLAGSISWSPDGTRLLVSVFDSQQVAVYDLASGRTAPVPILPGRRPNYWTEGAPRVLGWADERRLLVLIRRRASMTIAATDPDTGDRETLLGWTHNPHMYPVLAQQPTGRWP